MGGVADALFGSEKETHTERINRLTPAQMGLLRKLSRQVSGQIGKGVEPYPGQITAGPSPLQSTLFSILQGQQPSLINKLTNWGQQAVTQDKTYNPEAEKEYWQQSFVEPVRRNFWEETMPKLRERFAGQGALSSSGFNRAVARAASDMNTALGGKLADILYQGRQNFLNRQLQERNLGLSTLDQVLNEMNALIQSGQIQRNIEQARLNEALQKWKYSRPYNNPWLQQAPAALGVTPYQFSTYTTGGGNGLLGGMMPAIGAGVGSGLGSVIGGLF